MMDIDQHCGVVAMACGFLVHKWKGFNSYSTRIRVIINNAHAFNLLLLLRLLLPMPPAICSATLIAHHLTHAAHAAHYANDDDDKTPRATD